MKLGVLAGDRRPNFAAAVAPANDEERPTLFPAGGLARSSDSPSGSSSGSGSGDRTAIWTALIWT